MRRKLDRKSAPALPLLLLVALATTMAPTTAMAAGNANAKIMLHALSLTTKNTCARTANIPSWCAGYDAGTNNRALYPTVYYAYPLVVNGSQVEGIRSASFGIDYDGAPQSGVDIYGWTLCADAETPTFGWPNSGGGNVIEYNATANCQTGGNPLLRAVAALGYFYCAAYTPDRMSITRHPATNVATVTNCAGQADIVSNDDDNTSCSWLGNIGFGMPGHNACGITESQSCQPSSGTCRIEGPTTATTGQTGIEIYSFNLVGDSLNWTITGNGTFEGPTHNQPRVYVTAGGPGQFTVTARYEVPHFIWTCQLTVTIQDAVPTITSTWSRIKSVSRSR